MDCNDVTDLSLPLKMNNVKVNFTICHFHVA